MSWKMARLARIMRGDEANIVGTGWRYHKKLSSYQAVIVSLDKIGLLPDGRKTVTSILY